jgi:hypothetical protein
MINEPVPSSNGRNDIAFVQIAAAKDHLYGMTRLGEVWKFDENRQTWERMSMTFSEPLRRPGS